MKNKKVYSYLILFILVSVVFFYPSTKSLNINALQQNWDSQELIESFDRTNWLWSSLDVISSESTSDSIDSSLAVDSFGNVHVVWEDKTNYSNCGTDNDIFYKKWETSKLEWSDTEVISTESTSGSYGPSLAIDSQNNVHVVWYDYTNLGGCGNDRDIFYKKKDVVTEIWTTTEVISTESTGDSNTPDLTIDSFDNLHVAWSDGTDYGGAGIGADIFYKCMNKTLSSWTITEVVSTESTSGGGSWYASIDVDSDQNIHIAWNDDTNIGGAGTDEDIFYKKWNSSISAWTTTEIVSTESTSDSYRASLVVDSNHNAHIAWFDLTNYNGAGGDYDIFYKLWNLTSSSWTTTEVVSYESTGQSSECKIAIDSENDIHIIWGDATDYNGSGTDLDIFYKSLDYETNIWSPQIVVSTESTEHTTYPDLFVDLRGNIHVSWCDPFEYNDCGVDIDIFYKKYYKPLATSTELAFIVPNPSTTGDIYLEWNNIFEAIKYHVFRSTSYIWSIEGMTPIVTVTSNNYTDTLFSNGFYYYCIVTETAIGNSSKSNCMYVEVSIPSLSSPVLAFIVPNPTASATINLDWNDVPDATLYTLYRSTSFIWSVEGLTPIYSDVTSLYLDTLPAEGVYYYVVVASDGTYNSSSVCQYVIYELPHVSEFVVIISLVFGLSTIFVTMTLLRKKKKL